MARAALSNGLFDSEDRDQGLTAAQLKAFKDLKEPTDTRNSLHYALRRAYQRYRELGQEFKPDWVSSPFVSQCATYCVAEMTLSSWHKVGSTWLDLSVVKIYQAGTPTARLLILKDSSAGRVPGLIELNPAGTVSRIVEFDYRGTKGEPRESATAYDREWRRIAHEARDARFWTEMSVFNPAGAL